MPESPPHPPEAPAPQAPVGAPVAAPQPGIAWADPARRAAFEAWFAPLVARHGLQPDSLTSASADASFRRYFRVRAAGRSLVVMDAPPPLEDVRPFIHVAGLITQAGLHGPEVIEADDTQGFLLLSDLGHTLYLDALRDGDARTADALMRAAIRALVHWQQHVGAQTLPPYDAALLHRELALFPEWCVQRAFGITWTAAQQTQWQRMAQLLVDSTLAQPRVAVHRDWMPRNLMVCDPCPGILDFQDAVHGPVTYDIASLLRDAFLSWDEEREIDWAARYWTEARRAGLLDGHAMGSDFGEFWRSLEWMALQRHLKVMGIFCRLKHRDGKPAYSADLPRFFGYATRTANRYAELRGLLPLLEPLSGRGVSVGYTF